MGDESLEVQLARIEAKVESVVGAVECLPGFCETLARHDERIGVLERGWRWAFGVVATVLSGIVLAFVAFIREFCTMITFGGKP